MDGGFGEYRVVRQAAGGVVEGLGRSDRGCCVVEVGGLVDHVHGVAHPDPVCRGAGAVRGVDHRMAAGGHDQVSFAHQLLGPRDRRRGDHLDQIGRCADLLARLSHVTHHGRTGALRPGVRGDDDRIATLECEQCLHRRGGIRAGRRDQCRHDTHRFGDQYQAPLGVLGDDPDGAHRAHIPEHAEHPFIDLDDLVGIVSESAFVHGDPSQCFCAVLPCHCPRDGSHQFVGPFLAVIGEGVLRDARPGHHRRHVVAHRINDLAWHRERDSVPQDEPELLPCPWRTSRTPAAMHKVESPWPV